MTWKQRQNPPLSRRLSNIWLLFSLCAQLKKKFGALPKQKEIIERRMRGETGGGRKCVSIFSSVRFIRILT